MIVNQMRSEIQVSFLHDIALSADPMFMAQQSNKDKLMKLLTLSLRVTQAKRKRH